MFSQPVYSTFEIKLLNFIVYNSCLIQSCLNFQGYNKTSSLIILKGGEMGKTFQIFKFIWISIRNIVQYHAASCDIMQYHAISQNQIANCIANSHCNYGANYIANYTAILHCKSHCKSWYRLHIKLQITLQNSLHPIGAPQKLVDKVEIVVQVCEISMSL